MNHFHWRDTYRYPKFFTFDARSTIPLLIMLLHLSWWTLGLSVGVMIFFFLLDRRGLDFASALRAMRRIVAGKHRPPLDPHKKPVAVDFDYRRLSD